MRSNVRLKTNVICVQIGDLSLSHEELVRRLGYFEYLSYRQVSPLLFPPVADDKWTARQRWEMDGPRGRGRWRSEPLWRLDAKLEPIPAEAVPNPFGVEPGPTIRNPRPLPPPGPARSTEPTKPVTPDAEPAIGRDEQMEFVLAPPAHDMLVVAPPGTGKTHVLVERLAHLVRSGGCQNPLKEVLVLSYTRAAVGELRERLQVKEDEGALDRLGYCRIRTFDALATELLRKDLPAGELAQGYGARIEQFNRELLRGRLPGVIDELSRVRFFLVDEVQDLNGPRAEMVLNLATHITRAGGSVAFLGDPAQAIYDFDSDPDDVDQLGSDEFLKQIISGSYCGRRPKRIEFCNYRRFESPEILQFVQRAREAMGPDGLHPDGVQLDGLLQQLRPRVVLQSLASHLEKGRTAILTRNNLEAFQVWEWCRKQGIESDLWRGAGGSYWPGWIAALVLGFQNDVMSLEMAERRWDKLIAPHLDMRFPEALEYLRRTGLLGPEEEQLQVSQLAGLISRAAPSPACQKDAARLVISTIHRSKGLEFDHVLLLEPQKGKMDGGNEVRVAYVAATRARKSLGLLMREPKVLRRGARGSGHIKTSHFHLFRYPEFPHIGLLVDGTDAVNPASIQRLEKPYVAQRALWEQCSGRPRNTSIRHDGLRIGDFVVGRLSAELARDLSRIAGGRGLTAPTLQGVQVVNLATVAVEADPGSDLGASGLVLVPVTTGIGWC